MFQTVSSIEELHHIVADNPAVLVYYSHSECGVCGVLKPKVEALFQREFPETKLCYVDIREAPEVAGQESVFAVPTLVVYMDGREFIRESRNVSLGMLEERVRRPYEMMMG